LSASIKVKKVHLNYLILCGIKDKIIEKGLNFMNRWLDVLNSSLPVAKTVNKIIATNRYTGKYGLVLNEEQALRLCETRKEVLKAEDRLEFGSGIIDMLIYEFCDSPNINSQNFEDSLHELIRVFYRYKNETDDLIGDEELIKLMRKLFDEVCRGDFELLETEELDKLSRSVRDGSYFHQRNTLDADRSWDGTEEGEDGNE